MRDYEVIFIIHPDLDESAFNDIIDRINNWITDSGGKITKQDIWGKRKLAYPLRKQQEGQYVYLKTQISPGYISELERNMRLLEPLMRFLITKID